MDNKLYRINEFVRPADRRSLVVDTSAGLALGAPPGLEHFAEAVAPVLPLADGIVTSPGQARRLSNRTRADAALLVRADWTNALRGEDFVLPPETIFHIPLLEPADALDLGASALVAHVLLGHEEHIEAGCLKNIVQLALNGTPLSLPLIAEVQASGPRVVLRSKAIELGVSYSIECGADGVIIPWPGADSLRTILTMAAGLPVWIKADTLDPTDATLNQALEIGATGVWLGAEVFGTPDPAATLTSFRALVHGAVPQTA
jgi:DhnA family fructose-bisphosphate aldolase class Ia